MFGFSGKRWLAVAGVLTIVLAGGVAVAAASGGGAPKVSAVPKKALSRTEQAAATRSRLKANFTPATNVSCGQTIMATTTMNGDLDCTGQGDGVTLGKASITLNLNGHTILGTPGVGRGVQTAFNSDTIENGYIYGFFNGVQAGGASDTVTKMQVNYASDTGIYIFGSTDKATSNTAAENYGFGIFLDGASETAQTNKLLNNGDIGLYADGSADKILTNTANGNTSEGIRVIGSLDTITGNTANYNTDFGINAVSPQIDGGTNKATGNTQQSQCTGVVCAVE